MNGLCSDIKAVNEFNWEKAFAYLNTNQMVCVFDENIQNKLSNSILHENNSLR